MLDIVKSCLLTSSCWLFIIYINSVRSSVSCQCSQQNPHTRRPSAGWCGQLHLLWKHCRQAGWNWCQRKGENWQGQDSSPSAEKNVWSSTNLNLNTKITIYSIAVKPILLYGSETYHHEENIDVHQYMSNLKGESSTSDGQSSSKQPWAVRKDQTAASWGRHLPKTLEMNWVHT